MPLPKNSASTSSFTALLLGIAAAAGSPATLFAQNPCAAWSGFGTAIPGVAASFGQGEVHCVLEFDPDGPGPLGVRTAVGGSFTVAGGVAANNVAIFDPATGLWSGLTGPAGTSGVDGVVRDLAADAAGNLIVVGGFRSGDSTSLNGVGSWNDVTGTWTALGSGLAQTGGVGTGWSVIVAANGDVVVGGEFDRAGGTSANNIAVFNGVSWRGFGSGITSTTGNALVRVLLERANGDFAVGGSFTTAGGVSASNIAQFDGATWSALGAGTNSEVRALAEDVNGDLIAGGLFTQAGTVAANNLARFSVSTWFATSFPGGAVDDMMAQPNGQILVGGNFTVQTATGQTSNIARYDSATDSFTALGGGLGRVSSVFAASNVEAIAGGSFINAVGAPNIDYLNVARFDGTVWDGLGVATSLHGIPNTQIGAVRSSLPLGFGSEVVAGAFQFAGAVGGSPVASFSPTTGTWSPVPIGTNTPGVGLALARLLPTALFVDAYAVGGAFNWTIGGFQFNNIAENNGGVWVPLGSGTNGEVRALLTVGNELFVGGTFTDAGGVVVSNIARFDRTLQTWSALGSGVNGAVNALALGPAGQILVGGDFSLAGGVVANDFAAFDPATGIWSTVGPGSGTSGTGNFVSAIAVRPVSGDIVVGGGITSIGGANVSDIAVFDGTAWASLGGGVTSGCFALAAMPNDNIIAGGTFDTAGTTPASFIAQFDGTGWRDLAGGVDGIVWHIRPVDDLSLRVVGDFVATGGVANVFHATIGTAPACMPSVVSTPVTGPCFANILSVVPGSGQPEIGAPFLTSTIAAPPGFFSLFAFRLGTTLVPSPVSPTCFLDFTPEITAVGASAGLTFVHTFAIPFDLSLVGTIVQEQAVHFELANPSNAGVSNRLTLTLGGF